MSNPCVTQMCPEPSGPHYHPRSPHPHPPQCLGLPFSLCRAPVHPRSSHLTPLSSTPFIFPCCRILRCSLVYARVKPPTIGAPPCAKDFPPPSMAVFSSVSEWPACCPFFWMLIGSSEKQGSGVTTDLLGNAWERHRPGSTGWDL